MQAQLAQERFRAGNASYGSLDEIGVGGMRRCRATTSIEVTRQRPPRRTKIVATATGTQAHDIACRSIRLAQVVGSGLVFASGPDSAASNAPDANRKCWNQ